MKIIDTDIIIAGQKSVTVLFLDGKIPFPEWSQVLIGGSPYDTLFMSGVPEDKIAIRGTHDLKGMEVQFV